MKKLIAILTINFLFICASYSQTTNPAPYCSASNWNTGVSNAIAKIAINSFTNTTSVTNGIGYEYFNNLQAINLSVGTSNNILLQTTGFSLHYTGVFIDYNKDNDFLDPGELVFYQSLANIVSTASGTFTVPLNALTGLTRMRVIAFEDDAYTLSSSGPPLYPYSCYTVVPSQWQVGEAEDYNVIISAPLTVKSESPEKKVNVQIYPNPNNGKFTVSIAGAEETATVEIFDSVGKLIYKNQIIETANINVDLNKGIYFVKTIVDGVTVAVSKIISE